MAISGVAAELSGEAEVRKEIVGRTAALFGATTAAFLHWADSGNEPENLRQKDIYFYQLDQKFRDLYFDKVRSADPISRWTVKNHLQSIYEKVGVHNRIALSNLIQ